MISQIEAMAFSMGVEAVVAFALALTHGRGTAGMAAAAAILGTALTHPIVWQGALALYPVAPYWVVIALVESVAVFGEWPVYMFLTGFLWRRALIVSFLANAASFGLGLYLF
jgi:pimeloyl-ACP methyl ester carboxylesterase